MAARQWIRRAFDEPESRDLENYSCRKSFDEFCTDSLISDKHPYFYEYAFGTTSMHTPVRVYHTQT